jgi:hypothetical protein
MFLRVVTQPLYGEEVRPEGNKRRVRFFCSCSLGGVKEELRNAEKNKKASNIKNKKIIIFCVPALNHKASPSPIINV